MKVKEQLFKDTMMENESMRNEKNDHRMTKNILDQNNSELEKYKQL